MKGPRLTLGFLAYAVTDDVNEPLWQGVVDTARQHDANLICINGKSYHAPGETFMQANRLYELLHPEDFDGVLVGSILREDVVSGEEMRRFYDRLPRHVVSVRASLPGIPYVSIDNYEGMRTAIIHLIEVHHHHRIAFLRGPDGHPYAEERYRAYVDVLREYQLPSNPDWVTPPSDWAAPSLQVLLDERRLYPGRDFDAIVAACDHLKAFDALDQLEYRGIRVPHDVAVIGFDNVGKGKTLIPPLTTVRIPFYELGCQAINLLLEKIAGRSIPQSLTLPGQLVIRQSCGCLEPSVQQAATGLIVHLKEGGGHAARSHSEDILAAMARAAGDSASMLALLRGVLEGFLSDLYELGSSLCITNWNAALLEILKGNERLAAWQDVLSVLRRMLLPYLADPAVNARAEDLWEQMRVLLGETLLREKDTLQFQAAQQLQRLRQLEDAILTTPDVNALLDVLSEELPRIDIAACALVLYEAHATTSPQDSLPEWSRCVLAYTEQGRIELERGGMRVATRQWLFKQILPTQTSGQWQMEALFWKDRPLGYMLLHIGPRQGSVFEVLQTRISTALQGALMVGEITRQHYILDTFMANVPDSIFFKDRESRFIRSNQAHASLFGVDNSAELVGKSDFDFYPHDQVLPRYEQEQEILRTGQSLLNFEEANAHGSWTSTTKMPLRDEHGDIIGTFGISRDITALKLAQHELLHAYSEISTLNNQLTEENIRMGAELDVAQRLQKMILPAPHELREIQGVDIVGFMQPADEVGGDYYDVLLKHGVLHIGIGDVTGHGLESGVLMLMVQTTIRALLEHGETDPAAFVRTLNRTIYKNVRRMGADKTLTFAMLNYQHGQLKIVGQHEELLIVRCGGHIERVDTVNLGFPIGLEADIDKWVATATVALQAGDSVVLYTDGITEAEDLEKNLYGLDRLCAVLSRYWEQSAERMKQAVIDDVLRHIGDQQVFDDLTLVILQQQ